MSKHAKKSKSSEPEKINKDEIISESGEEKESVKESEDTAEEKVEEKKEEPEEVTAEEPEAEPEEKTEESALMRRPKKLMPNSESFLSAKSAKRILLFPYRCCLSSLR